LQGLKEQIPQLFRNSQLQIRISEEHGFWNDTSPVNSLHYQGKIYRAAMVEIQNHHSINIDKEVNIY